MSRNTETRSPQVSDQDLGTQTLKGESLKPGTLGLGIRVIVTRSTGNEVLCSLNWGTWVEVWLRDVPESFLVARTRTSLKKTHYDR